MQGTWLSTRHKDAHSDFFSFGEGDCNTGHLQVKRNLNVKCCHFQRLTMLQLDWRDHKQRYILVIQTHAVIG